MSAETTGQASGGGTTEYINHHLTHLKVGEGFWSLHVDTIVMSVLLGLVTLGMFFFKVGKSMWLYASKVPCSLADNLGAAFAGLSLSYAVSKAVWRGLFPSNLPFHRTPKMENQPAFIRGLVSARAQAIWLASASLQ